MAGNDGCIRRRLRWTLKRHVERELAVCTKNVRCWTWNTAADESRIHFEVSCQMLVALVRDMHRDGQ